MNNQPSIILSAQNLSKTIGKREIVHQVTFDVYEGEIFGFLGPNGAGKTTTIRMLVGLIRPTRGTVVIGGHDLNKNFLQAIRHIGCIVETPELYPYLTGRENLEHFARMMDPLSKERIDKVVDMVELTDRIDDLVKTYSLGMKQRLGIAQALLGNPKLLILDEPTNGLDPAGIREMRSFIKRLSRENGIAIFISSHILHEIQLLCDRVAIINQGKIIKTGRVDQLLSSHTQIEWKLDPLDQGIRILQELSHVHHVEKIDQEKCIVHMPYDQIAKTNETLIHKNIQVIGIRPYTQTLEDLFLKVTSGGHSE